ncbi:MAG: Cna B-type domain-containing protein [Lentihominibacter sp.]
MRGKRIRTAIIVTLLLALLVPVQASAIDRIDLNRSVSLTLKMADTGVRGGTDTGAAGMTFDIYRVADTDDTAQFTLTGSFASYKLKVNGLDSQGWADLAQTLSGYVARDGINASAEGKLDTSGIITFRSLKAGLYLVDASTYSNGKYVYSSSPFMISLPDRDQNSEKWNYDVTSVLKLRAGAIEKEPLKLNVHKVWDDAGRQQDRPESITVQLYRDGKVIDTVKLSEENSWRYSWEAEQGHDYRIAETETAGYTCSVSSSGTDYTITNTSVLPPETDKLPQTGVLWWPVPVLIVTGLGCIIIGLLRRRGSE